MVYVLKCHVIIPVRSAHCPPCCETLQLRTLPQRSRDPKRSNLHYAMPLRVWGKAWLGFMIWNGAVAELKLLMTTATCHCWCTLVLLLAHRILLWNKWVLVSAILFPHPHLCVHEVLQLCVYAHFLLIYIVHTHHTFTIDTYCESCSTLSVDMKSWSIACIVIYMLLFFGANISLCACFNLCACAHFYFICAICTHIHRYTQ